MTPFNLPEFLTATAIVVALTIPVKAQERLLQFEAGLGPQYAPTYEGSDDYQTTATGSAALLALNFGKLRFESAGEDRSFFVGPSFRYLGERSAADAPVLAGIPDIDWALEAGVKAGVTWENAEVFGAVRKGFNGHEGWTGEIGADAILRPSDTVTLRFGPRVAFADDTYMDTYFSVPASATALAPYSAGGGLKATGVSASVRYDLSDDWSLVGAADYMRLRGDAANSPIVQAGSDDQVSVRVLVSRRFTFRF